MLQESNTLSPLMDLIHFGQDSNSLALDAFNFKVYFSLVNLFIL